MDNSILSGKGGSGKKTKVLHLNPKSSGHKPKNARAAAAVHAIGRSKVTGNFAKIEAARGKGAAVAAYQAKLAAHKEGK